LNNKLSPEQIDNLWKLFKEEGDSDAKHELLYHYAYLVKWIVRRIMQKNNSYFEYDDFISYGMIGLINAVDKYELSLDVDFETYATEIIRSELNDYMNYQDWASPALREKINALYSMDEISEIRESDNLFNEQVADSLGMPIEQIENVLHEKNLFNFINFEDTLNRKDKQNNDEEISKSEDEILIDKKKALLNEMISELPDKERTVMVLHYFEGMTLKEVADILNVDETQVEEIQRIVLFKMSVQLNRFKK